MTGGVAIPATATIGVVGAGAMGAGIAQVAAAAGHPVRLFDMAPGAGERGRARTLSGLDALVARGRMPAPEVAAIGDRLTVAADLADLAGCALVIEAVVEDLGVKRALVAQLEALLADDAVIATNTSSISITAIARDAARPGRVVGMHFFNPAPVMKLVEIVSGAATDPVVAARTHATATAWGKVAVAATSTPGFIVNRVARPYYAEALRLLEEQVADPATIDALLVEGGGFRMGPFALMDLIGHDVNYAVTTSVFDAYHQDPRFRPSIAQRELVNAGRLGRKTGRGFFDHAKGAPAAIVATAGVDPAVEPADDITPAGGTIDGVLVLATDGRTADERADEAGAPVILCDLVADDLDRPRVGFATSAQVGEAAVSRFVAGMAAQGVAATRLPDWPGLVVMRTVAMLANEGFEAVMQGVADADGVDAAMRHGVNYPRGPIGWARSLGLPRVLATIDAIHRWTGDPRYRASMALRMAAMGMAAGMAAGRAA